MRKYTDLTGQRFGKLVVIRQDEPHYTSGGHRQLKWICKCDCGNVISVIGNNLRNGISQSCGCARHPDLTNQRFGKLLAIKASDTKKNLRYWTCKCDCGRIIDVPATQLTSGRTKSCGCLRSKKFLDLTGKKFGKLTAKKYIGNLRWECQCDCGKIIVVSGNNLKSGNSTSCGCGHLGHGITHGKTGTRLYRIYNGMKTRCYNPKNNAYKWYGERGITICQEWLDDFMNFYNWAMANGYEEGLSIDRIDNDGNYCPENCRWISLQEQQCNKRSNINIKYRGETKTLSEWATEFGIDRETLNSRINKSNWEIEKALTTPPKKRTER